jgi:hypothetical protein
MADDALRCEACGAKPGGEDLSADPDAELACVELVRSSEEYEVVASLLEAEGIPVALHNHVGFALRGLADGPFTWDPTYDAVRVMVPKAYEQAARELIAAQVSPDADTEAEDAGTQAG